MRYVGRLLKFTAKEASEVVERRLQGAGGSLVTWLTLQTLAEREGELQRQLAERLCIEGPTMTRHLDRLEADGLIERRPDPGDRRGTRIYATPKGRALLKELWAVMHRSEQDLLDGLSDQEADMLERLMLRLRENIWRAAAVDLAAAGRPAPADPPWMVHRPIADAGVASGEG
jgi:MarR family transcriptional regulator, transcriptional regulator for hemolysin